MYLLQEALSIIYQKEFIDLAPPKCDISRFTFSGVIASGLLHKFSVAFKNMSQTWLECSRFVSTALPKAWPKAMFFCSGPRRKL